jgi:ribonuclease E
MGGDGADGTSASPSAKRRRRRSRAKKPVAGDATAETLEAGPKKATPARTRRAKSQEPREPKDSAPTSTRLTRSRVGRTARRRREPMPYVPRVTDKLMVITEHGERDQIAVLEERELVQHYVTRAGAKSMVGNVYLGRVQNVLPGMEAAFVDVGRGRNAVLYAGEVNWSLEDLEGAPPRIEHVLKNGQSILVQVTKDPIGGKGARLTAQISLPGRYLVLAPNSNVTGISRRLPDDDVAGHREALEEGQGARYLVRRARAHRTRGARPVHRRGVPRARHRFPSRVRPRHRLSARRGARHP